MIGTQYNLNNTTATHIATRISKRGNVIWKMQYRVNGLPKTSYIEKRY